MEWQYCFRSAGWRAWIAGALMVCAATAQAQPKNVALLIGVGQFRDPLMRSNALEGPANDLPAMRQALISHWHFATEDVHVLANKEATHDRILSEIADLEKHSAAGDTLLIYFSGHGTSAADHDNQFDLPFATGAWVPYDINLDSAGSALGSLVVGRRDLVPRLKHLQDAGRFVVVVSDSCYSGQVVRALGGIRLHSRFLPLKTRDVTSPVAATAPAPRQDPPPYPYRQVLLLSGASDSEVGADISTPEDLKTYPTIDGQYHGAFTDAFLRLLDGQLLTGGFTYSRAREALSAFLEQRELQQHPQLLPAIAEDAESIGARPFLASSPAPAAAIPDPGDLSVRLEGASDALRSRVAAIAGVRVVDAGGELVLHVTGAQGQLLDAAGDPVLTATLDDGALLERVAAQSWLTQQLRGASGSFGLRAEASPASRGGTFVQCERFYFDVQLHRPGFLLLLDLDPLGHFTVLYPEHESERSMQVADIVRAIPGAAPNDRIVAKSPFGTDEVYAIVLGDPPHWSDRRIGASEFGLQSPAAATLQQLIKDAKGNLEVQRIPVHTYPSPGLAANADCTTSSAALAAAEEKKK